MKKIALTLITVLTISATSLTFAEYGFERTPMGQKNSQDQKSK